MNETGLRHFLLAVLIALSLTSSSCGVVVSNGFVHQALAKPEASKIQYPPCPLASKSRKCVPAQLVAFLRPGVTEDTVFRLLGSLFAKPGEAKALSGTYFAPDYPQRALLAVWGSQVSPRSKENLVAQLRASKLFTSIRT
jgi:hypothetical protein